MEAEGALGSGGLWRRLFGAVLQLSLAEWHPMEHGMASNGAGSRRVHSQHMEAEGALGSGGLWRRLFGAVLQLSLAEWRPMEHGMALNEAWISPGSQPTYGS
jgi:uncharacterized protein YjeT (DUF2065 family)